MEDPGIRESLIITECNELYDLYTKKKRLKPDVPEAYIILSLYKVALFIMDSAGGDLLSYVNTDTSVAVRTFNIYVIVLGFIYSIKYNKKNIIFNLESDNDSRLTEKMWFGNLFENNEDYKTLWDINSTKDGNRLVTWISEKLKSIHVIANVNIKKDTNHNNYSTMNFVWTCLHYLLNFYRFNYTDENVNEYTDFNSLRERSDIVTSQSELCTMIVLFKHFIQNIECTLKCRNCIIHYLNNKSSFIKSLWEEIINDETDVNNTNQYDKERENIIRCKTKFGEQIFEFIEEVHVKVNIHLKSKQCPFSYDELSVQEICQEYSVLWTIYMLNVKKYFGSTTRQINIDL